MQTEPRIDQYLSTLPEWQQSICARVRKLAHSADAEVEETIKRTNRPYFVLQGNICALLAAKDHVNIFLYDPTVPDPDHIINQGHANLTAKAIQVYEGHILNQQALLRMFKQIITNNRADGWRKLAR